MLSHTYLHQDVIKSQISQVLCVVCIYSGVYGLPAGTTQMVYIPVQ